MHGDRENEYCAAQALTVSAASTNKVKSGVGLGIGEPMVVVITVDVAPKESDANETYTAKVRTDDAAAMGGPTDLVAAVTIPRTAEIGDRFLLPIPPNDVAEDWTDVYFTLGGTNPSITVTARLIPTRLLDNVKTYPSGTLISGN